MAKYVPTPQDMLANAHNNWRWSRGEKGATMPRKAFDDPKLVDFYKRRRAEGAVYVALEDVSQDELRTAMEWYKKNTDWSAFKRTDWEKAYATLN